MKISSSLFLNFALLNFLNQGFDLVLSYQFGPTLLNFSLKCKSFLFKLFSFCHDIFLALLQFLQLFVYFDFSLAISAVCSRDCFYHTLIVLFKLGGRNNPFELRHFLVKFFKRYLPHRTQRSCYSLTQLADNFLNHITLAL